MPAPSPAPDDELYRALQQHLDRMPVPYPATESGVELSILRRLFSPEDARLALCLGVIPETLVTIHRRAGRKTPRAALAAALDGMAQRGIIQRVATKRGALYGKAPFVVGFYEAQVNRLTADLQRDVERYEEEAFGAAYWAQTPQLRTVPINEPISSSASSAATTTFGRSLRASPGPFAVMNCVCQQGKDLVGQPCKQTHDREHCLTLGMAAESMVGRGAARFITKDETLAFLDRADREGLVVEPQNTQDPIFICCCCGCCCGVLTTAKKLPNPASFFATNYHAAVDGQFCDGCTGVRNPLPDGGDRLRRRGGRGETGALHRVRLVRVGVPDRRADARAEARCPRPAQGHGPALRADVPRALRHARRRGRWSAAASSGRSRRRERRGGRAGPACGRIGA